MKKILEKIKYEYLEMTSYIILISWVVSPVVEYILKYIVRKKYTSYFVETIYIVGILGLFVYVIYIIKKIVEHELSVKTFIPQILIMLLLILAMISTIFSKNPTLSIIGERYRKEGLIVYIMYVGFIMCSSLLKNKKYLLNIFKLIVISALIITILPLFKNYFTYKNFTNVYHNLNHYGYFLMIAVMASIFVALSSTKYKKIFYYVTYAFLLHGLIRNDTFGCYLAVFISLLCLLIFALIKKYQRKNMAWIFLSFILISFFVSILDIKIGERIHFEDTRNIIINNIAIFSNDIGVVLNNNEKTFDRVGTGRGLLWRYAWSYTLENPLLGGGIETLNTYYIANGVDYNDRPHNAILQISAFVGIPAALVYLSLILYLAITNFKKMELNTINLAIYFTAMCYFISSIFGNSMYYTSPYFMILLGMLIGIDRYHLNKD